MSRTFCVRHLPPRILSDATNPANTILKELQGHHISLALLGLKPFGRRFISGASLFWHIHLFLFSCAMGTDIALLKSSRGIQEPHGISPFTNRGQNERGL